MRISDNLTEALLRESDTISDAQILELRRLEQSSHRPLQDLAIESNMIDESTLTKLYADNISVPFANLEEVDPAALQLLPERVARQQYAVVFEKTDGIIKIAMANPESLSAITYLRKLLGKKLRIYCAPTSSIESAYVHYRRIPNELSLITEQTHSEQKLLSVGNDDIKSSDKQYDTIEQSQIQATIEHILSTAANAHATTIHIEPHEHVIIVRARISGLMRVITKLPKKVSVQLIDTLKQKANISPQSGGMLHGSFVTELGANSYVIDFALAPILDGDKVTLTLRQQGAQPPKLRSLGFWGQSLKTIENALASSQGLLLVNGPSGSGKSTTLLAMLALLDSSTSSVATIEERITYRLHHGNQTQLDSSIGMDINHGLQNILRHDPDIILVAAIRDAAVAKLCLTNAESGKLILSTLAAGRAYEASTFYRRFGVSISDVTEQLQLSVAQRLLPQLCTECRISYQLNRSDISQLDTIFHINRPQTMHRIISLLNEYCSSNKISTPNRSTIGTLWRVKPGGCQVCNFSGYSGRMCINEVMGSVTKDGLLEHNQNTLEVQALDQNMIPLEIDGFIKALCGQVSIDDIYRSLNIKPLLQT